MKTPFKGSFLSVAAVCLLAACSDPTTPNRVLVADAPSLAISDQIAPYPPGFVPFNIGEGAVKLCKTANAAGTFGFTVSVNGVPQQNPTSITLTQAGTACTVVYTSLISNGPQPETVVITENANQTNWALTSINTVRYLAQGVTYAAPRLDDVEDLPNRRVTVKINNDMARLVTFTNTFTAPPVEEICDFITFGRLVTTIGGKKVVISGNAGGLNSDGSFKNEFHVEYLDVDYHVANLTSYGPITSGPLSTLTNSRVAIGTAKNGTLVELRIWDGGEPGKGTDIVWVKLGNTVITNANGQFIDQGNMQFHPTCRGPDGESN